jgi:succinate dehydrogenase / fumarate reductase cytochrome b subunit
MILGGHTLLRKLLMAVTGLLMLLFIIGHMLGNTALFFGPESINAYAAHLRDLGLLFWMERLVMLGVAGVHIGLGILLTLENRAARPESYAQRKYVRSSLFSRTMIFSGLIILAFGIFHVFHFTVGLINPELAHQVDASGRHDVYAMVVANFQQAGLALLYVAAMVAVLFHMSHGVGSLFQTMGWNNDRTLSGVQKTGRIVAIVLFIGFIAVPLSIVLGIVNS